MRKLIIAGLSLLALVGAGGTAEADDLVAAVLPSSRSGVINQPVTVFATMINASGSDATGCAVTTSQSGVKLDYQPTDPATNQPVGMQDTPVAIKNGAAQSFVLAFTSSVALQAVDVPITFDCTGLQPAAIISGLDTLLLSIAESQPADIVALALTEDGSGVVSTGSETGTGAFAVASIDIGAAAAITVMPNTGDLTNLPVTLTICQTDHTGACMAPPAASVTTDYTNFSTASFAVFVTASGPVPFSPSTTRVFVDFTDSANVVRGMTSVALEAPSSMNQTNSTAGGIYIGTWRATSQPSFPEPVSVMVSEDGEFHLLPGVGPLREMRETLKLSLMSDLTLTATGTVYAAGAGPTAETGMVTATGTFSPRRALVISTQSGTQTGMFKLNFVAGLYDRSSSLALIAGTKVLRDEAGNAESVFTINADGSFSAMTMAGCMETGSFSIIDANFSVYRVAVSQAGCGMTAAASFTGLATLQGGDDMDDVSRPAKGGMDDNGTLITEISNPTTAIANLITSQ